jgi:hypothetical protein
VKRGTIMPLSLLSAGDYFGEKSLLMHHRNAVSVVAIENCDTRVLEKMDFEDLCVDFPELKESILKRSDHLDVTEYDTHKKRRASMNFGSGKEFLEEIKTFENNLFNTNNSSDCKDIDGNRNKNENKIATPKGGVFSFEPPVGGNDYGGATIGTVGTKGKIGQVLNIVRNLNDRIDKMDDQQKMINNKLDQLLAKNL